MSLFNFFNKKKKNTAETSKLPHAEISNLEKAGLIFFKHKKYFAAMFVFERVLNNEATNANAWYGLGNCLAMISNQLKRTDLLTMAIACFKKAIAVNNGTHQLSEEFLDTIKKAAPFAAGEFENIHAANREEISKLEENFNLNKQKMVSEFSELKEDKMVLLMFLGDTAEPLFYPLLRHAILEENNIDVKFAALKRISFFKDEPDLHTVFEKLIRNQKSDEFEPYLSMALHSIDKPWTHQFKGESYRQIFK